MKWYGLLGKTLKHSFSKSYFAKKFSSEHIDDCRYENFELASIDELPELLNVNPDIHGLNVTIPYKEEILPFLAYKNDIVREINACNCIKISGGNLSGYNTDVIGFQKSLEKLLKSHHKTALILGTGGSAKAVRYALNTLGIAYQNVSRTKTSSTITYEDLDEESVKSNLLIVNTSPIGMYPNIEEAPVIPYEFVTPEHLLFDLTYNPEKTLFLKKGEEKRATIRNGSEMLILQAEESWKIWNS
jgi:shikimate dehydrogenase